MSLCEERKRGGVDGGTCKGGGGSERGKMKVIGRGGIIQSCVPL